MRTRAPRIFFGLPLAGLLVTVPVLADAPTSPPQYDAFLPDDPTVIDRYTDLEWARRVPSASDKSSAEFYCTGQAFPGGVGRLPTIKELHTIFDEEPHAEYETRPAPPGNKPKFLDRSAFGNDITNDLSPVEFSYWSQTPGNTAGMFWTLNFTTGLMEEKGPTQKAHTRCVR